MIAFHVLRHREFRYLWLGQTISVVGSHMQRLAVLWHIYQLTHSALALGIVGACRLVPVWALALLGGVVADRVDRRRVMFVSTVLLAGISTSLAVLTWNHTINVYFLYAAIGLSSAVGAFHAPARQSLIPRLVPAEKLHPAFTLTVLGWDTAGVVGPAIGGVILAASSPAWVYLIDAVSYVAVLFSLAGIARRPPDAAAARGSLREGIRFVMGQRLIASTMLLDFFATFFGQATVLFPVFAVEVLGLGAKGLGMLSAAPGVGSVLAGLWMATRHKPIARQGWVLVSSVLAYGLATIVFGLSRSLPLTLLALTLTGGADTISTVIRQTLRQRVTPDHLRGRMTGINMLFFQGGPQLGEFESGLAASILGPALAVAAGGGAVVIALAMIVFWAPELGTFRDTGGTT